MVLFSLEDILDYWYFGIARFSIQKKIQLIYWRIEEKSAKKKSSHRLGYIPKQFVWKGVQLGYLPTLVALRTISRRPRLHWLTAAPWQLFGVATAFHKPPCKGYSSL